MDFDLARPKQLDDAAWASIQACCERLSRASAEGDWPLVIGTAKDLLETTARVVLCARGEAVPSAEDLLSVLSRAHRALERQPGEGLASDATIRAIAQGAKTIASQLPELRNRYGTGHGRVSLPEVGEELVSVSLDAAMLWSRWALRRLDQLLAGSAAALARDLRDGGIFRGGELTARLKAADLPNRTEEDRRLIGVAVAQRAMGGTFVVQEDGVEACADSSDLVAWPPEYREGLVEGLFLDRDGNVDADQWAVDQAVNALAVHPRPHVVLGALAQQLARATWTVRFAAERRGAVVAKMASLGGVLPSAAARARWKSIAASLQERAASSARPAEVAPKARARTRGGA